MSIFEQTSSRPGSRFGKLSSNMFFIRNTAKPKRVRHIEGLNGALICNVNDDISSIQSARNTSLSFDRNNFPRIGAPRRTERLVPPTGFWNTYGVIHDTERWKQELAALASASGLGVQKDDHKNSHRPPTVADQQHASRSGAHYSRRTGRFNEGAGQSRGRTGSKHATALSDTLFSVPENEREMWMLQVLCQLLGTSHLEDVQSWLVSASTTEKEQARTMINSALRGLKESERTTSDESQSDVDFNSLSNFVERQQSEERQASQKFVQDTLNRSAPVLPSIDEEQQNGIFSNDGWGQKENNNSSPASPQNLTTYRRTFHNFNQRSQSSFETRTPQKKHESFDENESKEQRKNQEEIDTIQLDDDRQQVRPNLSLKGKVETRKSQSTTEKPPSSHKQKHRVESVEFSDDENNNNLTNKNEENDQQQEQQDAVSSSSSSHRTKPPSNEDIAGKTRRIRELQNKLSRQEEEAKKKFNELQSKQSRLENAIKLLAKQTSSFKKRRQHKPEQVEDLDAPVVNVIIQSPREVDHPDKSHETVSLGKQLELSSLNAKERSKNSRNGNNNTSLGDYTIQDVKVQISLSRLDNHPPKVYSGVWKPDASTLHRLQGN